MRAAVSIGIHGRTGAEIVRALARRVEALGFHALWINDVPGGDSLAGLRVAAEATTTLGLATGVIPLDRRPAESLDFAGIPPERTTIGIGSGGARHPLGLVRDGIATLRRTTDAALVVGALGPRMRRLAAEEADGVLLNWLSPKAAAEATAALRRDAAGRPARSILYARTIADEAARPVLEQEARGYETVPAYAANFSRLGIHAIDTTIDGAERLDAFDAVDELVLRAITPNGSLDQLVRFAEATARWRDAAA
jgi:alkanesulfonate monooxygenase SsuD/methylene tetrahydromethanopterin reductase-like flavin-dependent oxidoreductase (luciferase family)